MIKKKLSTNEIKQLEKQLAKHQKQYDNLRKQSPDRWWHDEHFDNQLRVLEAMIEETRKAIKSLNPKSPKVQAP